MTDRHRRLAVLGLFCLLGISSATRADDPPPLDGDLRFHLERAVRHTVRIRAIPGIAVAVSHHGRRWSAGFGLADVENNVPATPRTMFRYASVSKSLTAVRVLQLVESGALDLDADLQPYVPAFPPKAWPLTIRQLLDHQAGIRWYRGDEVTSTRHYASLDEALIVFRDDPLAFEPGTRFLYSSYGYVLLGLAVEKASGERYLDSMRKHVFEPSGMTFTRDDDPGAIIPGRAAGYRRVGRDRSLRRSQPADVSNRLPGGGFCGTAGDLVGFAEALMNGRLLSPTSVRRMFTEQHTRNGQPTGYALGWHVGAPSGVREVWHTGHQPQVSTLILLRPDQQLAVAILCNLEETSLIDLAHELADTVRIRQARAAGTALEVVP